MEKIIPWALQGIPECTATIFLSCKVWGFNFTSVKKKLLLLGLVQAGFAYVFRLLPFSFGIHSLLLTITLAIWTYIFTKKAFHLSILSSTFTVFCVFLFEFLSFQVLTNFLGADLQVIISNIWLRSAAGWPQIILLILTGLILAKVHKYRNNEKPVEF